MCVCSHQGSRGEMLHHSPATVWHGAEAGAAGPVPAGAQGAVLHSAKAAVPVSPAPAVQVSLYCSQCSTVQKQVPQVQCQQVPREQCSTVPGQQCQSVPRQQNNQPSNQSSEEKSYTQLFADFYNLNFKRPIRAKFRIKLPSHVLKYPNCGLIVLK